MHATVGREQESPMRIERHCQLQAPRKPEKPSRPTKTNATQPCLAETGQENLDSRAQQAENWFLLPYGDAGIRCYPS